MNQYCQLPLFYQGKVHAAALVDAEDFPRLSLYHWLIHKCGRPFRFGMKKRKIYLTQEITQAPKGVRYRNANGDPLDCRRENLVAIQAGRIDYDRHRISSPYRLRIFIENVRYGLGGWPSREAAEEARQVAEGVAIKLRGLGLEPKHIRHALLTAIGRQNGPIAQAPFGGKRLVSKNHANRKLSADELLELASAVLPKNLPVEIREEVQAAIVCDLLERKVRPPALKDARLVREYVRSAYGFQDGYRYSSLDAPVGDGESTLGDLIAA